MASERLLLQIRQSSLWLALATVIAVLPVPLSAQTAPPAEKTAPAPAAPDSKFAKQPGDLSDKLNASNGVIRPREVDPKIEKGAPPVGTTPVIHPPGSPEKQPGVEPK